MSLAPDKTDSNHQIVVGGQRVSMGVLLDLQRDAARYRWLRDKADSMACTAAPMVASLAEDGRMVGLIDGEELDAAVDMAMACTSPRRASATQRSGEHISQEEQFKPVEGSQA